MIVLSAGGLLVSITSPSKEESVERVLALPLAPSGWCLVWALPGLSIIRSTLEF